MTALEIDRRKMRTVSKIKRELDIAKSNLDEIYYRFCRCSKQSPVPMCELRVKITALEEELKTKILINIKGTNNEQEKPHIR